MLKHVFRRLITDHLSARCSVFSNNSDWSIEVLAFVVHYTACNYFCGAAVLYHTDYADNNLAKIRQAPKMISDIRQ